MATEDQIYQTVAARRLQLDVLLWQVPVLSLTAQAFLFTIALGEGNSRFARVLAATLSLIASLLSIQLMSRHRRGERCDGNWLEAYEKRHFPADRADLVVHGHTFRDRRDAEPPGPLGFLPGYWTWVVGLAIFGLAAVAVLMVAFLDPTLLSG